ncbi:MAG: flavin reductase family protein [Actinomycetota bacterium]
MKKNIGIHERLYPNPAVLVSSSHENKDNIITLAWAGTVCSKPPLISISIRPSRFSHQLIKKSGEFVINIPKKGQEDVCEFCGTRSGKDTDKFKQLGLDKAKPLKINTPLISQCPINIECIVRKVITLGTHDLFIGEVLCVSSDQQWVYEDGDLDYDKLETLTYCMGKYFQCVPAK